MNLLHIKLPIMVWLGLYFALLLAAIGGVIVLSDDMHHWWEFI